MTFLKPVLKCRGILALLFSLFPTSLFAQHYMQTNLVSSPPGMGTNPMNPQDPDLINPWGLTRSPSSPWWVSDNGTGLSTLYNGVGNKITNIVVTIPVPMGQSGPSKPTGVVVNGTTDFQLPGTTTRALFIFVTEGGTIAAWAGGSTATIVADNSDKSAVYKGCTIAELQGNHYLYVANFHSGEIEVYNSAFQRVRLHGGAFVVDDDDGGRDRAFNRNPDHLAPFNVQAIGRNVYVTYAKQDEDKEDDVPGPGLGAVVIFDAAGRRLARLQRGPWFNAPWGIAMAPGDFGEFSHELLVGMFGSGQIAAFNPIDGSFIRLMRDTNDTILSIDGLWALGFGGGNPNSGPFNTLFFTAGPNDEHDGLFGTLVPRADELAEADEP